MFDPKKYWDQRLKRFCNLEGVGCEGWGRLFNAYVYRAKVRTLERIVRKFRMSFEKVEVLDVGSGVGFWIDYYLGKGAKLIYGTDISSIAVRYLTKKYKDCDNIRLFEGDFSQVDLGKTFDIINAFDVAYHVVDDKLFTKFIENLCKHLKDGGSLFVSDVFRPAYKDRKEVKHVKVRALNVYRKILERNRVEIVSVVPMYSILSYPYTGIRRLDQALSLLHHYSTQFYTRFKPLMKLAYYIDSFLTQFKTFGISMRLLIGKRQQTIAGAHPTSRLFH